MANEDYGCDVEALRREIARLKDELALCRKNPLPGLHRVSSSPDTCNSQEGTSNSFHRNSARNLSPELSGSLLARTLSQPPKPMDKDLAAALRREQEKDLLIASMRKDLDALRDTIMVKENDLQKSKMIIKFRDDKIIRLEVRSQAVYILCSLLRYWVRKLKAFGMLRYLQRTVILLLAKVLVKWKCAIWKENLPWSSSRLIHLQGIGADMQ